MRSPARRSRPSGSATARRPQPKILGDVEPLFPRNPDERRWTALIGANAGVGEELFFRLMLPLLITLVTGNASLAFAAAGLIFGLVHFYQGWVGILATTVAGFVFARSLSGKRADLAANPHPRGDEPQFALAASPARRAGKGARRQRLSFAASHSSMLR